MTWEVHRDKKNRRYKITKDGIVIGYADDYKVAQQKVKELNKKDKEATDNEFKK